MSNAAASSSSEIRFGAFEVDAHASELRKSGIRIPLQQQPFRVLAFLIDRAGDVVTREELRRKLWPGDTYVDFEHGLNVAIARGREALGDDADLPRFIETLPKRGYRFITPVQRPVDGARERARVRRRRFAWATATLLLAAGATVGVIQRRRPPVLTDRDTILVADFVNKTGEEVFDDTLRQALTVYLEQSPFLSILSRNRVRETLKLMTQAPDSRVLGPVAREVCQRAGARVSIDGHIAALDATTSSASKRSIATQARAWRMLRPRPRCESRSSKRSRRPRRSFGRSSENRPRF